MQAASYSLRPFVVRLCLSGFCVVLGVAAGLALDPPTTLTSGAIAPPDPPLGELWRTNLLAGAAIMVGGCLAGLPTILGLLVNGVAIGFVSSQVLALPGGGRILIASVAPHGVLEIPAMLLFGAVGLGVTAHVAHLFSLADHPPALRRLAIEAAAAVVLLLAAGVVESRITPRILTFVLESGTTSMNFPSALLPWLLTVIIVPVPYLIVRVVVDRLRVSRPEQSESIAVAITLLAPVLSILVALAAVQLHHEWIARNITAVRGNVSEASLIRLLALLFGTALPVLSSLLWLASRVRRHSGPASQTERNLQRTLGLAVVAVTAASVALSMLLRLQFGLTAAVAGVVAAILVSSSLVVFGPLLVRLSVRPDPCPGDGARLAPSHALLAAHGFPSHRLEVVSFRAGPWANALAVGAVPGFSRIVLTRTLVDLLDPDEIAAVVAHEIGHLRRHHLAKLFAVQTMLLSIAIPTVHHVSRLLASLGLVPGALGLMLTGLGVSLVALPAALASLSRRFEREADQFARERKHAGLLGAALKKLQIAHAWPSSSPGALALLYALHPPIHERVRSLQEPRASGSHRRFHVA